MNENLLDYSQPQIKFLSNEELEKIEKVDTINPLYNDACLNDEFLLMCKGIETYYAPRKIITYETHSRQQIFEHLLTIFPDSDFCDALAGILKKDYSGKEGKPVPTMKEGRNWKKHFQKKCEEDRKKREAYLKSYGKK